MRQKIINYFYDNEEQHSEYKNGEYLVIFAVAVTIIVTFITAITV